MPTKTENADFTLVQDLGRAQVVECLVDGLDFLRGETPEAAQKLAKRVLANIIVEHLNAAGFVVSRRQPEPGEDRDRSVAGTTPGVSSNAY